MESETTLTEEESRNELVRSYLAVRAAIGALGLFLPAALLVWTWVFGGSDVRSSVSAYYYTPMFSIFVGTLAAIAVFLWNYEGYRPISGEFFSDKVTSRIAATGAALIALAPVAPPEGAQYQPSLVQQVLGQTGSTILHYCGAALFFGALAVFCLVLFCRDGGKSPKAEKRLANRIYMACGIVIVIAMLVMAAISWRGTSGGLSTLDPMFWLEVTAIVSFALSWLVKGKSLQPLIRAIVR